MSRAQPFSKWLHVKSFVVSKVVNLIVFTFIMTALVFVKRAHQNDLVHGQLDALYVTVTLLTTTGDDDRAPGVMLVLQLVRAIAVDNTLRWKCPTCGLARHDREAAHCQPCGSDLFAQADAAGETTAPHQRFGV